MMIIHVDDHVKNRLDATNGIRQSLKVAKDSHEPCTIIFSEGVYCLSTSIQIKTDSISHDDGCGEIDHKWCHIVIQGIDNLTLLGAENAKTILCGTNSGKFQSLESTIIWAENCSSLRIKNLLFTRDQTTNFFGKVVQIERDTVFIHPGEPTYPNILPVYCMNRFSDHRLVGDSITIGFGDESRMVKGDDGDFILEDESVAMKLVVGDTISWHQSGLTDFTLFFGRCDDLKLENLSIVDASGFALLTENCHTIEARHLVIKPANGYTTASRDGWKIFRCSGQVKVDHCYFEGTRMDAQNVHGNYMQVERIDGNVIYCSMKYAPTPMKIGSTLMLFAKTLVDQVRIMEWELISSEFKSVVPSRTSTAAISVAGKKNRYNHYRIVTDRNLENLPELYALVASCMTVDSYTCTNSTFRNIAGAGNLVRSRTSLIKGNLYENMMNAGILIGAEWDTHNECMNVQKATICDNTFMRNGYNARYKEFGCACISICAQGFNNDCCIRDIKIVHNSFFDSRVAIEARNVEGLCIKDNSYVGIEKKSLIDTASTRDITLEED